MNKIVILLFASTFLCKLCLGQISYVDIKFGTSTYLIDSTRFNITTIKIENIYNENLTLWFDKEYHDNTSIDDKIKSFFIKVKGDFSLLQLVNENISTLPEPVLFLSLFKEIKPYETFSVCILCKDAINAKCIDSLKFFFNHNLVCSPSSKLISYFDIKPFQSLLYPGDILLIPFEQLFTLKRY